MGLDGFPNFQQPQKEGYPDISEPQKEEDKDNKDKANDNTSGICYLPSPSASARMGSGNMLTGDSGAAQQNGTNCGIDLNPCKESINLLCEKPEPEDENGKDPTKPEDEKKKKGKRCKQNEILMEDTGKCVKIRDLAASICAGVGFGDNKSKNDCIKRNIQEIRGYRKDQIKRGVLNPSLPSQSFVDALTNLAGYLGRVGYRFSNDIAQYSLNEYNTWIERGVPPEIAVLLAGVVTVLDPIIPGPVNPADILGIGYDENNEFSGWNILSNGKEFAVILGQLAAQPNILVTLAKEGVLDVLFGEDRLDGPTNREGWETWFSDPAHFIEDKDGHKIWGPGIEKEKKEHRSAFWEPFKGPKY
jgi:hypothetical protein